MDRDFEKQEKRIESVFPKKIDDISRRTETLDIYKRFLEKNIDFPVKLTGIEDFNWEGFYILGPGDKREYEELKKTKPSYSDIYNLVRIEDHVDEDYGLFAKVTRISDKKRFQIPLADLEAVDENSKNYQLLNDYSVWCVNY
ncbi:MAG: calcium-binding protein [Candidatus Cloacimonadota bacterium]|nr:calcium-binding protein [Candidatus Cloacimonadota bacterium]